MKHPTKTALCLGASLAAAAIAQPAVTITGDNTQITESCVVHIPKGTVISDTDGNGVIQIAADGVTVEFAPDEAELFGASEETPWDALTGIGIRVEGHKNVTIRGARLHRFKVAIWASDCDGLTI
ncbi:MAG: hypothetical protein IPJ41_17985 [Phycisphaerales bacterium]|nr:hypothetical protein [Phycisphaerales bacterium]